MDVYTPSKEGRCPVVCALHGADGIANNGYADFAQMLANRGFFVCVPHYFDATGTEYADSATVWKEYLTWLQTVSDGLDFAAQQALADGTRVGVIGFSLGGFMAISLGAQQPRIKAVVDFFGGLTEQTAKDLTQIAPVLILHGEKDDKVPVSEAHKIARLLESRGLAYEMKLYPNAGHVLRGLDMMDAGQRTYFFLKRHLVDGTR